MNKKTTPYKQLSKFSYSLRRYYLDDFFIRKSAGFSNGIKALDLGGVRGNKRSLFSLEDYGFDVKYANLTAEANPDYLCDAGNVPVDDNTFDLVILSEVIEHVKYPLEVFQEVYRILKPGGTILATVPFSFYYHPCPTDFGRYTQEFYEVHFGEIGFRHIQVEKQGLFFGTMAEMIKALALHAYRNKNLRKWQRFMLKRFALWFQYRAIYLDSKVHFQNNLVFFGYTTGYGISANKGDSELHS